jgi:hypothetical protein
MQETSGLKAWPRRLVEALVIAGVTYVALRKWGSSSGASDDLIVSGGALVAALFLLPALEFTWHFAWAPWRDLVDEVADLKERAPTKASMRTINVRVTLRNQARKGRELLERSQAVGVYSAQSMEADAWANAVVGKLAKYVTSADAERFLDVGQEASSYQDRLRARVDVLEEIAASAPTKVDVPRDE